ncbi:hypothetical protein DYE48_11805 [Halobacillus trueperi]|uniref:Uncharacterized protein n=1 Tax=Halobacillus trueperi TaxID=156205 RepID=A0A3E0J7Y1_9BACI|nr:hypothetical protein DYE48_11805 [Halobacillus trueperi]
MSTHRVIVISGSPFFPDSRISITLMITMEVARKIQPHSVRKGRSVNNIKRKMRTEAPKKICPTYSQVFTTTLLTPSGPIVTKISVFMEKNNPSWTRKG